MGKRLPGSTVGPPLYWRECEECDRVNKMKKKIIFSKNMIGQKGSFVVKLKYSSVFTTDDDNFFLNTMKWQLENYNECFWLIFWHFGWVLLLFAFVVFWRVVVVTLADFFNTPSYTLWSEWAVVEKEIGIFTLSLLAFMSHFKLHTHTHISLSKSLSLSLSLTHTHIHTHSPLSLSHTHTYTLTLWVAWFSFPPQLFQFSFYLLLPCFIYNFWIFNV